MVDSNHKKLGITRQCDLLNTTRAVKPGELIATGHAAERDESLEKRDTQMKLGETAMSIASYVLVQISNVVAEAIQSDDEDGLDQNVAAILREAGASPEDWERILKDAFVYILEMRFNDGSILADYAFSSSETERLRKFVLSRPEEVFENGEIDENAWDEWETTVEDMDLYDPKMDEIFLTTPDGTEIKILRQSCYDALAELYCLPDPERNRGEDDAI